jgi:hypothetical protein
MVGLGVLSIVLSVLRLVVFDYYLGGGRVRVMVFNPTFNNISAMLWRSVLLVEEIGENHRTAASL